ncbi:MAG: protein kinase [Deltaproteobacteria bacterium]|nr:protein kinase [Deltaproteobacteria bacterium]
MEGRPPAHHHRQPRHPHQHQGQGPRLGPRTQTRNRRPTPRPGPRLPQRPAGFHRPRPQRRLCVVTRHNLVRALVDGAFPGATSRVATNVIDTPRGARIVDALRALGFRNSKGAERVAGYRLGDLLDENAAWQDFEAHSEQVKGRVARARVYNVPQASKLERREQLVRAAQREAEVLNALSDHPNILRMQTSVVDGPGSAPCLLFDRYPDETDLESFLRRNPKLPFQRRVEIVEQIGHALAFCHRKGVIHRGLDPSAVLVRRVTDASTEVDADAPVSVRLLNFPRRRADRRQQRHPPPHRLQLRSQPRLPRPRGASRPALRHRRERRLLPRRHRLPHLHRAEPRHRAPRAHRAPPRGTPLPRRRARRPRHPRLAARRDEPR